MARICNRCGRPLDEEHHDVLRYEGEERRGKDGQMHYRPHEREGEACRIPMIMRRGRGRVGIQQVRRYGCRVRLVATSPITGKHLNATRPQRLKVAGSAAYVPIDVLAKRKDEE